MIAVTFAPVSVNSATLEIEDISSFAVDCWTEDEVHSLMIVNTVAGHIFYYCTCIIFEGR